MIIPFPHKHLFENFALRIGVTKLATITHIFLASGLRFDCFFFLAKFCYVKVNTNCTLKRIRSLFLQITGTNLGMRPANEIRRYTVIPSPIGWAHTQNDPWIIVENHRLTNACLFLCPLPLSSGWQWYVSRAFSCFSEFNRDRAPPIYFLLIDNIAELRSLCYDSHRFHLCVQSPLYPQ